MAKKKKSKFKKILKNLGKLAAVGAAGYGASKMFGGSQGTPLGIAGGGVDAIVRRKAKRDAAIDAGILSAEHDFKKGGRVTGVAKRGFGRALMKGKK